jgi:hypothetical protein
MEEVIISLKNRIKYLEKVAPNLESSQQENIIIELRHADDILKRMALLCMVISK